MTLNMAKAKYTFPTNFLWGTATSGYQVEGQSTNTDMWQWEQMAGHIAEGQKSRRACDWWEGRRWQEDFDRAAADGHTAHRLSVEWSRIEPAPGHWDEDALDHYRQMIQGLRARGLEPMVTLHHYVNPLWLAERQAWETGEVVALFERYVRKVVSALSEHVTLWCTINEPNVFLYNDWLAGLLPPGKKDIGLMFKVAQHILKAHAAAYHAIHALQPKALVGLPIHIRPTQPARSGSRLDGWVARTQFNLFSNLFPDAIRTGTMRQLFGRSILIPEAKGTWDYFGLNYYTGDIVRFDPMNPGELFGRRSFPPEAELDDLGFSASFPPGLYSSLVWARQFGLPIYVTENGVGDAADRRRPRSLLLHLRQLPRALNLGLDVRGYFHWSLVDNFEWGLGWTLRFGLYAMDPETLVRTPRPSAHLYAEICKNRSISADMVARYAPELLETFFKAEVA
jgi:beta-glucosidase